MTDEGRLFPLDDVPQVDPPPEPEPEPPPAGRPVQPVEDLVEVMWAWHRVLRDIVDGST